MAVYVSQLVFYDFLSNIYAIYCPIYDWKHQVNEPLIWYINTYYSIHICQLILNISILFTPLILGGIHKVQLDSRLLQEEHESGTLNMVEDRRVECFTLGKTTRDQPRKKSSNLSRNTSKGEVLCHTGAMTG